MHSYVKQDCDKRIKDRLEEEDGSVILILENKKTGEITTEKVIASYLQHQPAPTNLIKYE